MLSVLRNIPERLKRVTSGRKIIREIDGLRFAAIMPVVFQHLSERMILFERTPYHYTGVDAFFHDLFAKGYMGVHVFFMISGFILSLPFATVLLKNTSPVPLDKFYLRRVTRLEPPYIIWMSIIFVGYLFTVSDSIWVSLQHLFYSLIYLHGAVYLLPSPINPIAWTLEIEIQFYLLAPFLVYLFFSIKNALLRRTVLLLTILGLIYMLEPLGFDKVPGGLFLPGHLHVFLGGFLLTDLYVSGWNEKVRSSIIFDFLGVFSFFFSIYVRSAYFLDYFWYVFFMMVFFISVFRGVYLNKFFTNKWITGIGGMCYTIYLVHLAYLQALMPLTSMIRIGDGYLLNFLVQALILLPPLLVVCIVGFLLFEKPFMNKEWPGKVKAFLSPKAGQ